MVDDELVGKKKRYTLIPPHTTSNMVELIYFESSPHVIILQPIARDEDVMVQCLSWNRGNFSILLSWCYVTTKKEICEANRQCSSASWHGVIIERILNVSQARGKYVARRPRPEAIGTYILLPQTGGLVNENGH